VTKGQLPQRAGSLGLTAVGLPPRYPRNVGDYMYLYYYTLCSEKNTHSQFLSYLHECCIDLNENCIDYTQGTVDSNNAEIRYSLRPMT